MEKINVAEEMLRILPTSGAWNKGHLYSGTRRCLLGARLHIAGVLHDASLRESEVRRLQSDPYMRLLTRIVEEQYLDRVRPFNGLPVQEIIAFNDHGYTTYADVRLVLEKARAAWEENHG